MHVSRGLLIGLAAAFVGAAQAKVWSFEDGTVSIQAKGEVERAAKQKLKATAPLSSPLTLGPSDSLKVALTATENKQKNRPHQAFLTIRETKSGLEDSFPLSVKAAGDGKVDITQKDLPTQFLASETPLKVSIIIGSFGSSTPLNTHVFDLKIQPDPSASPKPSAKPVRYGKREEIHHIFRADPQSPPIIITLVFVGIALATLPALGIVWLSLGANVNHLQEALGSAPLSHATFLGSIVALEGIFFMYYKSWTLFQMLPAVGVAGLTAFISGSKALSEVQGRRLAGKR